MKAEEIESYLSQLGQELANGGVKKPIRILMIGGAYMLLLLDAPRTTDDVDFFWLEEDDEVLQKNIYAFRDAVEIVVANNKGLDIDWINYMTHWLMLGQVTIPRGRVWKRFGPLYVHVPSKEFVLALKIIAGRTKDMTDLDILYRQTKIRTQQQAQELLDRYMPPEIQEANAEDIEKSFQRLLGKGKKYEDL